MPINIDFSRFYELINKVFWDFFDSVARIRLSFGGSGSGKSVATFQECVYRMVTEPGHNYLICRKAAVNNKISTFALFKQLVHNLALNDDPDIENIDISSLFNINKSDMTITCKHNGNQIIFKGLDDIEKIKSITFPNGVLTDVIVEEASEITQKDFDQLNVRLRGKARVPFQITLLLNPILDTHWIKREFIDKKSYQKRHKVYVIKTTYLDNEFIDDDYKETLEAYKDIDYEFYRVYCLAEWGSFGNIIFSNYEFGECPYKEEDFDAIYIGQDFGYNHPNVIVKIGFKDGVMYTYDELCCFEKTNKQIINLNKELDLVHKGELMRCDSAEPDKIKEWVQNGYTAVGAHKIGSTIRGIDFIKTHKWVIDDSKCVRTAKEVQTYHWKEDKDGEKTDKPVELFDDAMKAHIYALEPLFKMQGKPSVLSGKKSEHKKGLIETRRKLRREKREAEKILRAKRKSKKIVG